MFSLFILLFFLYIYYLYSFNIGSVCFFHWLHFFWYTHFLHRHLFLIMLPLPHKSPQHAGLVVQTRVVYLFDEYKA